MGRPRAPSWDPRQDARDEHLAFLAARDGLRRAATPWWTSLLRVLEVGSPRGTRGMAALPRSPGFAAAVRSDSEARSERMRWLVIACDDAAQRLTAEERQALRESGQLPKWFLPTVIDDARRLRRAAR